MLQGDPVVGYVRVSTAEQAHNGYGLAEQRNAIEAECERRGWFMLRVEEDRGVSGATTKRRPGLARAIAACDSGEARGLVASKVDRVSRSVPDFAALIQRAQRKGWNLVVLDLGLDLSSPMGEAMANMAAVFAQLERRLVSQRTTAALAVARRKGVRLGRPPALSAPLVSRIRRERDRGASLQAIAERLNSQGVPTAQGGRRWYPATIAAVLRSRAA